MHRSVFIAGSADVIGDVEIGEDSSVWFSTVGIYRSAKNYIGLAAEYKAAQGA